MKIKEVINKCLSKPEVEKIAHHVLYDEKDLDVLIAELDSKEEPNAWMASWVLRKCADVDDRLICSRMGKLISCLERTGFTSVRRNITSILIGRKIAAKYEVKLFDLCMEYIANPREAVAVKANALSLLGKICNEHPLFINEVEQVLDSPYYYKPPAAIVVRIKAFRKAIGNYPKV